ncbi:MAG: DNA polymerase III subunit gamma/tau, partial [Anaerolineaceae bacterium]|nr:DNA polymerase III subunit gamma/tau [Anaerolineaceae bacterium]
MSQALYRTWRPALWEEVVGQEHIVQTLKNAITGDRVGHAYLFAGPKGTGKTTSARLLAKAVNCLDPDLAKRPCNQCANCLAVNEGRFLDLIEIDAASNTSVDDIRELRDRIGFAPSQGRFKVYIIDEVHMLSTSAFNALLKTLEEPPAHVIFILATTEIHKIPATVLSRCQRHEFRRIPVPLIVEKLKVISVQEGIQIDPESLSLIARQATGSMRDAISLLDQLASMSKHVSLAITQDILGTATSQAVIDLVDSILSGAGSQGLEVIHKALDSGADPRQFARQMVDHLRNLLVIKLNDGKDLELLPETRVVMTRQAQALGTGQLIDLVKGFGEAANDLKASWQPSLGLELAYASAITWQAAPAVVEVAKSTKPAEKMDRSVPVSKPQPSQETGMSEQAARVNQATAPEVHEAHKPAERKQPNPASTETGVNEAASGEKLELSMETVRGQWDVLKRAVREKDSVTSALFNSARLMNVRDSTVMLNLPSELLQKRMLEEKNQTLLRK